MSKLLHKEEGMRTLVRRWLILGLVLIPSLAAAQVEIAPDIYPYPIEPVPATESAELTIQAVFDGEGEAAVAADLQFNNVQSEFNSLTVTIPGDTIRIRRVLQEYPYEVTEEYCDREGPYDYELKDYPCLSKGTRTVTETRVSVLEPETEAVSGGLRVTLPLFDPLGKGDSTHIGIAYKATGYVTDRLGTSQFSFVTPTIAVDLDTVRVRVDVQEDLILKGGQAITNYEDSLAEGLATATVNSFSSGFGGQLGSVVDEPQAFTKTARALDPNESFEVQGVFATSWLWLYWPQTLLIALLFLAFVGLIIWGEKRANRSAPPLVE